MIIVCTLNGNINQLFEIPVKKLPFIAKCYIRDADEAKADTNWLHPLSLASQVRRGEEQRQRQRQGATLSSSLYRGLRKPEKKFGRAGHGQSFLDEL
jgi:hypothetical protein